MERRTYMFTVLLQTFNNFELQTEETGVMLIIGSMSALISYLEKLHSVSVSVPSKCWGNDFRYATFQILTYSLLNIVHRHLIP